MATPAELARSGGAAWLAEALQASRADTLATFAALEAALPGLQVPQQPTLNPPLWELGHIGWFQGWWLARFDDWRAGPAAEPDRPRRPAQPALADAWYDSSRVPHALRWGLPLPDADATRGQLQAQLDATLALLAGVDDRAPDRDAALYFFRLALLHEDMHHEAALYMARQLGVPVPDARWAPRALPEPPAPWQVPAGRVPLGRDPAAPGFAFDNELGHHDVDVPAFEIDAQVLRWADYLPFVHDGGYRQRRWWSDAGWAWRQAADVLAPRYLRPDAACPGGWQAWRHGRWQPLALDEAAVHLGAHEAQAWCRWAGRRLPTEAEWVRAAAWAGAAWRWGDVWEWTASRFAPFDGFRPHPYRDYSAPWFDGRPVLRGASGLTQPRLRHLAYRNFFPAHRHDVPAGLRSCAA